MLLKIYEISSLSCATLCIEKILYKFVFLPYIYCKNLFSSCSLLLTSRFALQSVLFNGFLYVLNTIYLKQQAK